MTEGRGCGAISGAGMFRNALLFAKKTRWLAPLYERAKTRYIAFGNRGHTRLDLLDAFPLYRPYSGGSYRIRAPLAVQAINDMVPALKAFADGLGIEGAPVMTDSAYAGMHGPGQAAALAGLFEKHGSDKSRLHDYHRVYASILARIGEQREIRLLEIGLGTNNTDVASNMGIAGRPGASLRAFRDFLPRARIYGADIDRRILFSEDRIETFHVDQTDRASLAGLGRALPAGFHLMIDDGLHVPSANLNALSLFLSMLEEGGFAVVEDIPRRALDFWQVVAGMLPDRYGACIVESGPSLMFVVQRQG